MCPIAYSIAHSLWVFKRIPVNVIIGSVRISMDQYGTVRISTEQCGIVRAVAQAVAQDVAQAVAQAVAR